MAEKNTNRSPCWITKSMEPNEVARVKILAPKAIMSGTSKYGRWEIWPLEITNQTVSDADDRTKIIENYSGKAVFFPSKKLAEKMNEITGGKKENVIVDISKKLKPGVKGGTYFTDFEIEVVNEGNERVVDAVSPKVVSNVTAFNPFMAPPSSIMTPLNGVEQQFVNQALDAKKQLNATGNNLTKDVAVQGAVVSYNIKKDRAEEIFEHFIK